MYMYSKAAMERSGGVLLSLETPGMRREIVRTLGDVGDLQSVEILMQRLGQDEDKRVRQASAIALAKLRDNKAIPALAQALDDPDRAVKTYTMRALRMITGETRKDEDSWRKWWEGQPKARKP